MGPAPDPGETCRGLPTATVWEAFVAAGRLKRPSVAPWRADARPRVLVSVVSDVHGNVEDLTRVAESAELLVILGDLLEYVDYHDPGAGILGMIFGEDRVRVFAELRASGDFAAMHAHERRLWESLADPSGTLDEVIRAQYQRTIDVLGSDTIVTLGNVDHPVSW